jgi:hypothetical protein
MKNRRHGSLGVLAIAMAGAGCGGAQTEPQSPVEVRADSKEASTGQDTEVLKDLIAGFAKSRGSEEWVKQNAPRIDAKVTKQALQLAHSVVSEDPDKLSVVYAAFNIAAIGLLMMGEEPKAVECQYNAARAAYMLINDPKAYAGLRLHSIDLTNEAKALKELQLAAHAATLAANCSYFGSALAVEPKLETADAVMADWIEAAKLMLASSHPAQGAAFEDFASLGGALARDAMAAYSKSNVQNTSLIKEFTSLTEQTIPVGFRFQASAGSEKALELNRILGELSKKYGNPQVAANRSVTAS